MPGMYSEEMLRNYIEKRRSILGDYYTEIFHKYHVWLRRQGLSDTTRYLRLRIAYMFLKFLKENGVKIEEINQKVIDDFIDNVTDRYDPNTLYKVITTLRSILKFLDQRIGLETSKINLPRIKRPKKLPNILEEEEIIRIATEIQKPRYQLLFAILYETGARRWETLNIKLKHIKLHENYAEITIPQSKSQPRVVPVILFYPLLQRYLESHPCKDDPEAYLFHSARNCRKPISITTVRNFFADLSATYGKKITPHILRHSRGTQLAKLGLMEKEIMLILGHSTRQMIDVYVHLAGRDARAKLLSLYGIGNEQEKITPIRCPRCGHVNPSGAQFCIRCGHPLTTKSSLEHYEAQRKLELILRKLENVPLDKLKNILD